MIDDGDGFDPGAARRRLSHELHDQPVLRARLLDTLGGIDTELGLYGDARPLLTEALALRERLLGRRDPAVADTLVRLGSLAHLSGKGDAEPLFRRALAIREAALPADDLDLAATPPKAALTALPLVSRSSTPPARRAGSNLSATSRATGDVSTSVVQIPIEKGTGRPVPFPIDQVAV